MKPHSMHKIFLCVSVAAMWLPAPIATAAEAGTLGSDDIWSYSGDVAHVQSGGPFCVIESNGLACAHGKGSGGTDGGESYSGMWANGAPDGFGTYENDELQYIGNFSEGRFQGKGVITCYRSGQQRVEGTFVDGKLDGKPESPWSASRILLRLYNVCQ